MLDAGSASEPVDPEEAGRRGRVRFRWVVGGFCLGIFFALVVTAIRIAWSGWGVLPLQLIWSLLWAPYLGAIIGYNRCPVPRPPRGAWRRPRLSTRTLMVVVAYVALLFGAYQSTDRLGWSARLYTGRASSAERNVRLFRDEADRAEKAGQRYFETARRLRAGEIPATLPAHQRGYFESIEMSDPEGRKLRLSAGADHEEHHGAVLKQNALIYRRLAGYHAMLAAKYNRARRRPWLAVAPDPPAPGVK